MKFLRMRPLPKLFLHFFNLVCAWNFVRTMRHLVVCYILHIFLCLLEPRTWNYVVEQVCCKFVVGTCVCMMASVNCVITWDVNL